MNKKIKVTIGIPVYNSERSIKRRIEEICSQTFQDFVIVISDNASTDKTRHICEEFSKEDERISIFHQEKNLFIRSISAGGVGGNGYFLVFVLR